MNEILCKAIRTWENIKLQIYIMLQYVALHNILLYITDGHGANRVLDQVIVNLVAAIINVPD